MLHSPPTEARRLTDLLRKNSEPSHTFQSKGPVREQAETLQIVLEGGVLRQRFLVDGRKQTIAVYLRDDVINLGRYAGAVDHDSDYLLALKGSVIGSVPDSAVATLRSQAARGLDGIGTLVYRELGIAQERAASLGQRSAAEAMAHFFCEILVRCLGPRRDREDRRCALHMSQDMLGSVLGLSAVHVNRTLQGLRALKLADVIDNELVVFDFDRLAEMAGFDESYLAPL